MTAAIRTINNKVIKMFNTCDLMFIPFSIPNSPRLQNATQTSFPLLKYFEEILSTNKALGQNSLCQTFAA